MLCGFVVVANENTVVIPIDVVCVLRVISMPVALRAKMTANSMTTLIMIITIIVITLGDRERNIKLDGTPCSNLVYSYGFLSLLFIM